MLKKTHQRIIVIASIVVVVLLLGRWLFSGSSETEQPTVTVTKGEIKDQALAMGALIPRNIINVKSQISGIVSHILPEEGSQVERGDRLIEIQPNPTPREYVEARQAVDVAEMVENYRQQEFQRLESLRPGNLASRQELDNAQEAYKEAVLQHRLTNEKLQLLEEGKATVAGKVIESTLFSPISGYVLATNVSEGDAVVPLTENQDGTILLTLADMSDLVFKGTVDQIDIGRIQFGQPVEIQLGALPDQKITGKVSQISLQATNFDEDILLRGEQTADMKFKVEVNELNLPPNITWRSGYSAVAYILVNKAENTLLLPERVIEFVDGKTYVQLQGKKEPTPVTLGMSDGVNVQILEGVQEGDAVIDTSFSPAEKIPSSRK